MKVLVEEFSLLQARILKELIIDGRKSIKEIARKIGETEQEVKKQYQKMKSTGIIKGATIHINYKKLGYKAVAYMIINVNPPQAEPLVDYIRKLSDIYAAYGYGPKGNVCVVATLKTTQAIEGIKDEIKQQFPILNIKTIFWIDVKEMHSNMLLHPQELEKATKTETLESKKPELVEGQKISLDETDLKIIEKLSYNGRVSFRKIAQESGISTDTAKRRCEKLIKNGILKVTIQINPMKIGYQALTILFITISAQENCFSIIDRISRVPDVISIMKTMGDYDLQVYIMIRDINQLLTVQEEIEKISGITRMEIETSRMPPIWPSPRQYSSTF